MNTTTYLASKPRYEILDGLRGVAAMIVVAYHLFETYSAGPVHQILNHRWKSDRLQRRGRLLFRS